MEAEGGKLEVGEAMRAVMPALKGQADGSVVKKIVEEILKSGRIDSGHGQNDKI